MMSRFASKADINRKDMIITTLEEIIECYIINNDIGDDWNDLADYKCVRFYQSDSPSGYINIFDNRYIVNNCAFE